MITKDYTTLERIHRAAFEEFLEKGFKSASLRNIVKKSKYDHRRFLWILQQQRGAF